MSFRIAICAIGYNRPDCMSRLLKTLAAAQYDQEVLLIVSIDRSQSTAVKEVADLFVWNHGEKKVILQPENLGLRKHVLTCGEYIERYDLDALVVLEDDITVSPYFFHYITSCLEKYSEDDRIAGFSLYNFPVSYVHELPFHPVRSEYDIFMMNCAMSWGEVWTRRKWKAFIKWYNVNNQEFNLKHLPKCLNEWPKSSWLKYHTRYCIEQNKYFIFPYQSLVTNNNEVGTHATKKNTLFQSFQLCLPLFHWKLPTFEECIVKYDGFFEPKFLAQYLSVDSAYLTVDLYRSKSGYQTRYVLSTRSLPYHILKSFDYSFKPIEANILFDRHGSGIFLYDTSIAEAAPVELPLIDIINYNYYEVFWKLSRMNGVVLVIKSYLRTLKYRINNRLKMMKKRK